MTISLFSGYVVCSGCQVRDGAALCEYLAWLEKEVGNSLPHNTSHSIHCSSGHPLKNSCQCKLWLLSICQCANGVPLLFPIQGHHNSVGEYLCRALEADSRHVLSHAHNTMNTRTFN